MHLSASRYSRHGVENETQVLLVLSELPGRHLEQAVLSMYTWQLWIVGTIQLPEIVKPKLSLQTRQSCPSGVQIEQSATLQVCAIASARMARRVKKRTLLGFDIIFVIILIGQIPVGQSFIPASLILGIV